MIEASLEKIWTRFENKYIFLAKASRATRQLIEDIVEGRIDAVENPYMLGLNRTLRGEEDISG
ncbi:hypothetical protein GX441_07465 [bacterium]|nr:hypothetical protein [bacterium]